MAFLGGCLLCRLGELLGPHLVLEMLGQIWRCFVIMGWMRLTVLKSSTTDGEDDSQVPALVREQEDEHSRSPSDRAFVVVGGWWSEGAEVRYRSLDVVSRAVSWIWWHSDLPLTPAKGRPLYTCSHDVSRHALDGRHHTVYRLSLKLV